MSDTNETYDELIKVLDGIYDIEALNQAEIDNQTQSIKEARDKVRRTVQRAKSKGGFSNTKIARFLKEEKLFRLIEIAGAEYTKVMFSEIGYRDAQHKQMLKHFVECSAALYQYKNGTNPLSDEYDVTQLVKLQQWVFIGLNTMLDAAAIPATNDLQIRRTRGEMHKEEEKDVLPFRPEVTAIKKKIGQMICFQMRLDFVNQIWSRWFSKQKKDASKKGSAGLRYFQRDMNENIQHLLGYLQLKGKSDQDTYERIKLINDFDAKTHGHNANEFLVTLGSWIYAIIIDNLTVEETDDDGNVTVVHFFKEERRNPLTKKKNVPNILTMIKDQAGAPLLTEAWNRSLNNVMVKKPMLSPPQKLTAKKRGGRKESEDQATLNTFKGDMEMSQTRVDFFNRQALVPFKVNEWVLKVLIQFKESNLPIGNFDYYMKTEELMLPSERIADKPAEYFDWDTKQKLKWCKQHPDWRKVNRQYSKEYEEHINRLRDSQPSKVMFHIAEEMVDKPVIFIPTRPEFRARLLTDVLYLSYQGRDAAKALIKLAQPVSITDQHARERTRWWLANQLAANFNKTLDKLPISKRVNKVEAPVFQEKIRAVAEMDQDFSKGYEVLKEVDAAGGKPMLFAAACREWYELFQAMTKDHTDLIVSNDCSCSGQQFAAGWRQSKDLAIATNAYPNAEPHDLYKDVFNEVTKRTTDNGGKFSVRHMRDLENKGFGRDICKGGIQPAMYGSGEATALEGVVAKLDKYQKKGMKLSEDERKNFVDNYQDALNEVAEMNTTNTWFKQVSSLLARRQRKSIIIPTPLGDNIVMSYEGSDSYRVDTFRYGSCTYKDPKTGKNKRKGDRQQTALTRPNGKPDRKKWRSALAANTTHGAGDASMLALALHDADFHFVTCHDSVGCAGPHMDDLRQRMRQAYVQVCKFNIFDEILKANDIKEPKADWVCPMVGNWDPEEALHSEYLLS